MKIHIVQKGDTLWKIANKYGVDFTELKQVNSQLSNPDMIMPGMKIKIPTGGVPVKKKQMPAGTKMENIPAKKKEIVAPKAVSPYVPPKAMPMMEEESEDTYINMIQMPINYAPQQPPQPPPQHHYSYTFQMPQYKEQVKPESMEKPGKKVSPAAEEAPLMPNMQQMPMMQEMPNMQQMPMAQQPYMPPPSGCVPCSPVLPGSGLPGCGPDPAMPMPYGGQQPMGYEYGMQPGMNPGMNPDMDFDESPEMPQMPAFGAPGYGMEQGYGGMQPGYGAAAPGYMPGPGFGTAGYGAAPGYGPGPGFGPGYGAGPGYGPGPAYGAGPGYGAVPGYGAGPGFGAGAGMPYAGMPGQRGMEQMNPAYPGARFPFDEESYE